MGTAWDEEAIQWDNVQRRSGKGDLWQHIETANTNETWNPWEVTFDPWKLRKSSTIWETFFQCKIQVKLIDRTGSLQTTHRTRTITSFTFSQYVHWRRERWSVLWLSKEQIWHFKRLAEWAFRCPSTIKMRISIPKCLSFRLPWSSFSIQRCTWNSPLNSATSVTFSSLSFKCSRLKVSSFNLKSIHIF